MPSYSASRTSRSKPRLGAMEPLKVICNPVNESDSLLTNGVEGEKFPSPPSSPKQKEPRAKMSLSPTKSKAKMGSEVRAVASRKALPEKL